MIVSLYSYLVMLGKAKKVVSTIVTDVGGVELDTILGLASGTSSCLPRFCRVLGDLNITLYDKFIRDNCVDHFG